MNNPLIARFDGEPVMVNPEMGNRFAALLEAAASHEMANEVMRTEYASGNDFWTELGDYGTKYLRPYRLKAGVLQVPIRGVLLKDFPYQYFGYATGYEYIREAVRRGLGDDDVKGIALIFDTPGGMVAGNFDLVDEIYEARGTKPIAGFADESAYSAGYSLISAVDPGRVNVARTGGVGSIGVVTAHVDMSKAMDARGVKVTFIHAGKYKVEGNPYEALSPEAKARIQERIDGLYDIFVSTVARNRGLDEKAVRKTEALTFSAPEAVSNGLADSIGSLDDAIAVFAADMLNMEDDTMSDKNASAVDQAAETARAEGFEAGKAEGRKEGVTSTKERISAIIASDEGKKRPKAALSTALKTDMSAEDANAFLAELPEEKAEAPAPDAAKGAQGAAGDFVDAMNKAQHPNAGVTTELTAEQASAQRRKAAAAAAGRLKSVE